MGDLPPPTERPVAVRAWTTATGKKRKKRRGVVRYDLGPSRWSLTFDTETTLDPGQGLRVGGYQLRRGGRLKEEGLFYDPDTLTNTEIQTVVDYCEAEGIECRSREEFVEEVFLHIAWDRRGLIVGHNLPFDLVRISIANGPTQSRDPSMRGGFSLTYSTDPVKSHIQVKRINAGGAFLRLTIPSGVSPEKRNSNAGGQGENHHGYFLDTATLAGAIVGKRPKLAVLAELLGTETRKADATHGEQITSDYLDYLRTDVQTTHECAVELRRRYDTYDLPKEVWEVYSEASVGKAHLQKIGLTPFRELNAWPEHVLATVMETYYGGRTECMIRRTPVPGVYVDFKSQYPTAYCLQGLQRYLIADQVEFHDEDPARIQALLDQVEVDAVLDHALWPDLDALVLVTPDGDRLPTRAPYGRRAQRAAKSPTRSLNVGVPYRSGGPAQWYTLADCIASKLMTGKAPRARRVIRFDAGLPQQDLYAIDIAGNSAYRVDPNSQDFIARLVEMRADVKTSTVVKNGSDDLLGAAGLDATQQAMKATANSSAYGSPIEMNPIEHRKRQKVLVHQPSGESYHASVVRTERVGKWFHPLIASLVAAGGRLLLAAAMRLVADRGGHYAFCDTDSLFIVATEGGRRPVPCPGGTEAGPEGSTAINSLSWDQVEDIVQRFTALNPYAAIDGSILEIEKENYDPNTGQQREVECFAIASKRYGLFTREAQGRPDLITSGKKRKRSEHGLGHLLPPRPPSPGASGDDWMDEWWDHLIHVDLGLDHPEPEWFDEPAIGRVTITSPRDIKIFKTYNANQPYAKQVKPWGFLCLAHPTPQERARPDGPRSLIAPFERDPAKRRVMTWIDRDRPDRDPRRVHTGAHEVRESSIGVLSYRDYFNSYRQHPELKTTDPADGEPCHTWTRGLLQPRHIAATELIRVGKESNRLADTNLALDEETDAVIIYPTPTRQCRGCEALVSGRRQWCSERCRKRVSRLASKAASTASIV